MHLLLPSVQLLPADNKHAANMTRMFVLQLQAKDTEVSRLSAETESLGLELDRARGEVAKQQVQLQELDSLRQELAAAYENNAGLRDRVTAAQQELAEVKAEAAARTPVGATVEQVSCRFIIQVLIKTCEAECSL